MLDIHLDKEKTRHYDIPVMLPFIKNVSELKTDYLFHGIFAPEAIQDKIQDIGRLSKIDNLKKLIEMVSQHKHSLFTPIKVNAN
jgi:hypothetical protein